MVGEGVFVDLHLHRRLNPTRRDVAAAHLSVAAHPAGARARERPRCRSRRSAMRRRHLASGTRLAPSMDGRFRLGIAFSAPGMLLVAVAIVDFFFFQGTV